MSLNDRVYDSLKWKKNDEFCATKLGITLEKYKEIKEKIKDTKDSFSDELDTIYKSFITKKLQNELEKLDLLEESKKVLDFNEDKLIDYKEDIEAGTAELKAISFTEPKSAEDIEKVLKLDLTKWKLVTYWNKERNGHWEVSAMVSRVKLTAEDHIKRVLTEVKLDYKPITKVHLNSKFEDKTCAILSLQDIHIGKTIIDEHNTIEASVKACVENLILRSYHSNNIDKIIFVLGGDLLNMDTYTGTTTGGTPVENSMPAYDAYKVAFELMFWSINYLKQFCNELEVVYIPGNHSRLTEAHIAYSLSRLIKDTNIVWNIEYAERKVVVYGDNFFAFEHGDFDLKKSLFVFATEFSKQWGATTFRTLYTGHFHKEKKIEYITGDEQNGFTMKILPSLSKTDKWHHTNKFTGSKRGGIVDLHSLESGPIGHFSYYEK